MAPKLLSNICFGCLSQDRRVTVLDDNLQKVFVETYEVQVYESVPLCWECMRLVKKFISFKCQVALAVEQINNCKFTSLYPDHSLSKLKLSRTNNESYMPNEDEEGFKEEYPQTEIYVDDIPKADSPYEMEVKTEEVDFDDSDDEPLSLQKMKKEDFTQIDKPKPDAATSDDIPQKFEVRNNKKSNKKLAELNMNDGQIQLVYLSWDEVSRERERSLQSSSFQSLEHKCFDCLIGFNHRVKLENHMKKHDESFGDQMCNICKIRCKGGKALENHLRRHRARWRCAWCGALSSRGAVAADHVTRVHHVAATYTCTTCQHKATSLSKLRAHAKIHGKLLRCHLCEKTFRDPASLRIHLFIHRGEKEYSCPHCAKQFLFKKALQTHLETHMEPARLYCVECDLTFKTRSSYYGHMTYNLKHIDPAKLKHTCGYCGKRFAKSHRLSEHENAIHLKTMPFKCPVENCDFTKKCLEGHLRSHSGTRSLVCSLCPSSFTYEAALYNHQRLRHNAQKISKRQTLVQTTTGPVSSQV